MNFGYFLRNPWCSCEHVQALKGCFHVRKKMILEDETKTTLPLKELLRDGSVGITPNK